jgi:hypothetical protein
MKRLVVLLASSAALGALAIACGGSDKPPLTPDTVEPLPEVAEAGAPTTPATPATPAAPAPGK